MRLEANTIHSPLAVLLLTVFVFCSSNVNAGVDCSLEDQQLLVGSASHEWRDPDCGCWIYSPSEPIDHRFSVWLLTAKALTPLDDDFTADYFLGSEGLEGEDLRDPVSSTVALLTVSPVIQETDTHILCGILQSMLFTERWVPPGTSLKEQEDALLENEQMPLLYDEALRRLRATKPDTPILDIWFGTNILMTSNWLH